MDSKLQFGWSESSGSEERSATFNPDDDLIRGPWSKYEFHDEKTGITYHGPSLLNMAPEWLIERYIDPSSPKSLEGAARINYSALAKHLGVTNDEVVAHILELRYFYGVTREAAMLGARSETRRKAIQSAWRMIDRRKAEIEEILRGRRKSS